MTWSGAKRKRSEVGTRCVERVEPTSSPDRTVSSAGNAMCVWACNATCGSCCGSTMLSQSLGQKMDQARARFRRAVESGEKAQETFEEAQQVVIQAQTDLEMLMQESTVASDASSTSHWSKPWKLLQELSKTCDQLRQFFRLHQRSCPRKGVQLRRPRLVSSKTQDSGTKTRTR